MEHGFPDPQQLSNGGEGSNEQNDRNELNENEEAYDDDIAMEDRPPDDIDSVGHQEDELGEDDIAENDPYTITRHPKWMKARSQAQIQKTMSSQSKITTPSKYRRIHRKHKKRATNLKALKLTASRQPMIPFKLAEES